MANMDIFSASGFDMMSLTNAFEKVDHVPGYLGSLGLFQDQPIDTLVASFDRRDVTFSLIPTTPVGAPVPNALPDPRDIVKLDVPRLADGVTMYANEVSRLRAFGSLTEQQSAEAEFLRRTAKVRNKMEMTHEHMRLGAVQGKVLDADGTTVIYDYFTEFNEAEQPVVNFGLDTDSTEVVKICRSLRTDIARTARGALGAGASINALCGDTFYADLVTHPKVEKYYIQQAEAAALRNTAGQVFDTFTFGGITFHHYRGSDDNETVAIPDDEARFFPAGGQDIFAKAMGPHQVWEFVNTLGRDTYADRRYERPEQPGMSQWVRFDLFSYPLYVCQQPRTLRSGVRA